MTSNRNKNYRAFEISGWLPHPKNKTMGRGGGFIIQADKATIEKFAELYVKLHRWPVQTPDTPHIRKHVHITIQKGPRGKVEDYDNLQHYAKAVLDALTSPCYCDKCKRAIKAGQPRLKFHKKIGAGLLWDDNPQWCTHKVDMAWGPQPALIIEITDAVPLYV